MLWDVFPNNIVVVWKDVLSARLLDGMLGNFVPPDGNIPTRAANLTQHLVVARGWWDTGGKMAWYNFV